MVYERVSSYQMVNERVSNAAWILPYTVGENEKVEQ
jgi:hypothetical protein